MSDIIVIIGESASGKSTIEKQLVDKGFKKIVSYTTRGLRVKDNEVNGVDYHYVSDEEFMDLFHREFFAEQVMYNDWYYGIAVEDCKDDTIVVVEPHGFRQLKAKPYLNITSFYIKVDERERGIRMIKRGDNLMEVFRRLFSDQGTFQGVSDDVDYVVDNNNFEAFDKICEILGV